MVTRHSKYCFSKAKIGQKKSKRTFFREKDPWLEAVLTKLPSKYFPLLNLSQN